MLRFKIRQLLLSIVYFSAFAASAEVYILVDKNGIHHSNYDEIVDDLRTGDVVVFGEDRFTLNVHLGTGGSTRVFTFQERKAAILRIPSTLRHLRYTESYLFGMLHLKKKRIPVPEVYKHVPNQYTIAEELDKPILFYEMLNDFSNINAEDYNQMKVDFFKFLEDIDDFRYLNDVHLGNLAHVKGRGWYVLDSLEPSSKESVPSLYQILKNKELGFDFRHLINSNLYLGAQKLKTLLRLPSITRHKESREFIKEIRRFTKKHKLKFYDLKGLLARICKGKSKISGDSEPLPVHD